MGKRSFVYSIVFLGLFLPIFSIQAQGPPGALEITPEDLERAPQELTPAQDCQIERIGGRLTHRLGCLFLYPDLLLNYFIISGIFGGILAGGGYLLERKFGQPRKYKKLLLVALFLLPFIVFLLL